jgi:hypothetical protein
MAHRFRWIMPVNRSFAGVGFSFTDGQDAAA